MRISRIFPLLVAALSHTPVTQKSEWTRLQKDTRRYHAMALQAPERYGITRKGWRKAQSVRAHREIQRRQRRNA